jgi:hypothetical protein
MIVQGHFRKYNATDKALDDLGNYMLARVMLRLIKKHTDMTNPREVSEFLANQVGHERGFELAPIIGEIYRDERKRGIA